jgi:hypothetical protein
MVLNGEKKWLTNGNKPLCVTGMCTGSDFHHKHTLAENWAIPVYQLKPT